MGYYTAEVPAKLEAAAAVPATAEKLVAIAQAHNVSVEQVKKLVLFDRQSENADDVEGCIGWFATHPESVETRLTQYNAANPKSKIKPGAAQRIKVLLIVVAVLAALGAGYFAYKKFKK